MMGVWMMWWRRFIRGICFEEISEGEPRCRCGGGGDFGRGRFNAVQDEKEK